MSAILCKPKITVLLMFMAPAMLIQYPVRTLTADVLQHMATRALDDPATEYLDALVMSEDNLPAYRKAADLLEYAAALDSTNSAYPRALAEIYDRVRIWATALEKMNTALPKGAGSSEQVKKEAETMLKKTIRLEPANPESHFTLGQFYADIGVPAYDQELQKAVSLYPENSAIRYFVAMEYLLMGDNDKALEQATMLAEKDDSYKLYDDDESTQFKRDRRLPGYLARLERSYLFKALEIAWRASGRDEAAVRRIMPSNEDAQQTMMLFLEQRS